MGTPVDVSNGAGLPPIPTVGLKPWDYSDDSDDGHLLAASQMHEQSMGTAVDVSNGAGLPPIPTGDCAGLLRPIPTDDCAGLPPVDVSNGAGLPPFRLVIVLHWSRLYHQKKESLRSGGVLPSIHLNCKNCGLLAYLRRRKTRRSGHSTFCENGRSIVAKG